MRMPIVAALVVSLLGLSPVLAQSLPADDGRIAALGLDNPETQTKALRELVSVGAPAVPTLLAVLDNPSSSPAPTKMAWETLFRMVQTYAGTDRGAEVENELRRELRATHPTETKRRICTLLGYIAEENAVIDVLYVAMNDPELTDAARRALARIPNRRATQCLMGALQITKDEDQIGVIGSLGLRGELMAADYLAAGLEVSDPAVYQVVLHAIAQLPAPQSFEGMAEALKNGKPGAASAVIRLMETLMDADLHQAAEYALKLLTTPSSLTVPEQCRLLHACGRLGTKEAVDLVFGALGRDDIRIRSAAVAACALLPSKELTSPIAERMARAEGTLKVDLLEALGQRGQWMNETAAAKVVEAISDTIEPVQLAAIKAVETAGIDASAPALVKVLSGPAGEVRDAAEHALNWMPGQTATAVMAKAADTAAPEARAKLIAALGRRGERSVLPVLIKAGVSNDRAVRVAAFRAIGSLQAEGGLDALLVGLKSSDASERDAADRAIRQLQGEFVTPRLLAAYREASEPQKAPLLRIIGSRKHLEVPALLAAEAASPNVDIQAAAIEGLGRQDDPTIAPRLLDVARKGPGKVTEAAVGGCLRAAKRVEGLDKAAAGRMYVDVMPLAVTDDQKREALGGIARCAESPPAELLSVIVPLMQRADMATAAAPVAARVAAGLPEPRKAEAIDVLQQVLKIHPDPQTTARAAEHLRRLGVDLDPAREAGFITQWWLLGPLPNQGNQMWNKSYPPEENIDLKQPVRIGDKELQWRPFHTQGLEGVMDMDHAIGPAEYIGAYAYAEIEVDAAQDVVLKIGSDDSLVIWLNGKKVYAFDGARGVKIDQDKAEAHLQSGVNRVLVKSLDQINDWAFCIRVTTPARKPVVFKQKKD
jgi:HEAT repeat protein